MEFSAPRIVLVDDHKILTESLKLMLGAEFQVVGCFDNGRDLLPKLRELRPDAAIVDVSMPGLSGYDLAQKITAEYPQLKIVFLTMHDQAAYVKQAFRCGASGYVLKRSAADELINAVKTVLQGETYVSPSIQMAALPQQRTQSEGLTSRQWEVLQLIAQGCATKEIASTLNISVKTVDFHRASIMERLGLRSTAQLTRYVVDHEADRKAASPA